MPDETGLLAGRRILLTRPREQSGQLAARLLTAGAEPIIAPAIAIQPPECWEPLDDALRRIEQYQWLVVTSPNAAGAVRNRLAHLGIAPERLSNLRVAAVGPSSAAPLEGLIRTPMQVAEEHTAAALAARLPGVAGQRVLFPRGDLARGVLPQALRARGATVDEPVAYRTVPGDGLALVAQQVAAGHVHAIVFASPSAVRLVAAKLAEARLALGGIAVICLGPVTAQAARDHGLHPDIVGEGNIDGLADDAIHWFTRHVADQ